MSKRLTILLTAIATSGLTLLSTLRASRGSIRDHRAT